jgi:hypothetical protein
MDNLIYNNSIITFNGINYPYEQVEKIDDMCVHVFMGGQVIALVGNHTVINGKLLLTADEIIAELNNA